MLNTRTATALILAAALAFPLSGICQYPFQANLNLVLGSPQNEFKQNVDNSGYGVEGHFAYNLPRTPMLVGVSLSYLIYGSQTSQERLIQTAPVWVDVNTTNSLVMGHLLLRLQNPSGTFRPYVDGLLGFHYLTTDTKIENQSHHSDEEIASSNNFNDLVGSYGGGGGFMFQVYHTEGREETQNKAISIYVDIGFRYLKGGKAEYLKEGSISYDKNNNFVYDVRRSTTDIVTWHLGVGFGF